VGGWVDGWIGGWLGGWMDGRVEYLSHMFHIRNGLKYGHALSQTIFISSVANEWKDVSETEQAIFVTSLT
jgi:hypothetical protein